MLDLTFLDNRIRYLRDINKKISNVLSLMGVQVLDEALVGTNTSRKFNLDVANLKELRVACVMDRFTLESYMPECQLLEVTPTDWKNEIDTFKPHMLFIESAWEGKEKQWYRKIANGSKEYFEMTSYCQEKNIPIVFWNKEDPVYTDTFMITARMADFVFTTDIDCVKKYKKALKHDNVYHLHFAAQPEIHNPIEKYERKDKYCFAGAYYHKYVKRCQVFDEFSKFFIETKGLDIYDRNYKNALPEHAFPSMYDKYILGKLDPSEIDIAYKGYNFGINMNSVEQSQTMFARRVFEMLASNTVTIGNYSRGVKNLFGDLTICTNDGETLKNNINAWCKDEQSFRKYRLLGLRKVLSQHLYEDRLAYIVEKVFGKSLKRSLPMINVFCKATTEDEVVYALKCFDKQKYINKKLYLITDLEVEAKGTEIIGQDNLEKTLQEIVNKDEFITILDVKNYYGENYLLDLALSTRYGQFNGVGKVDYYRSTENGIKIECITNTYKKVVKLDIDKSIILAGIFEEITLDELMKLKEISHEDFISVDEFNFCEGLKADTCLEVDDLRVIDQGIEMHEIERIAEGIRVSQFENEGLVIDAQDLFNSMKQDLKSAVAFKYAVNNVIISSNLGNDDKYYINVEKWFKVADFIEGNQISLRFNGIGSLDNLGTCIFYDANKNKLSAAFTKFNQLFTVEVPNGAIYFKLNFRLRGNGEFKVKEIILGATKLSDEKACFISRSNTLVLTNQYPSQESLYRNMFVHKRMMAYKEEGFCFDIMKMNIYAKNEYKEFEGINVVEGQGEELANILETGHIDTVCVHFLDRPMWEVLKSFKDKIRIFVWVHGVEIQPWWRRKYTFNTKEALEKGKIVSEEKMKFWDEIFKNLDEYNLHFIFVSQYFADTIFEDYKIVLPPDKYSVIHNLIDTDMFEYVSKNEEQRKKILSIRPYASNTYANDIMVQSILELSKKECFKDMEFRIIGNGELFDETIKPLKKFKNITIEKKFLRQQEIAKLHKEYGVFVTPSRMDTQGVSRDEAMSSGLVPVTTAVAAIPEFVDEQCGVLVPGEDYKAMAQGIERLYNEPEHFLQLSQNAADRVRRQTSKQFTIDKEIELIGNSR